MHEIFTGIEKKNILSHPVTSKQPHKIVQILMRHPVCYRPFRIFKNIFPNHVVLTNKIPKNNKLLFKFQLTMNSFSLISMPIGVDSAICYRPFGTKPRTKPWRSSLKRAKLYSEKSIVIKKVSICFGMFNPIAKMAFGYFF